MPESFDLTKYPHPCLPSKTLIYAKRNINNGVDFVIHRRPSHPILYVQDTTPLEVTAQHGVDRDPIEQTCPNFKHQNYHEMCTNSTRMVSDLLIFVGSNPTCLSQIHSLPPNSTAEFGDTANLLPVTYHPHRHAPVGITRKLICSSACTTARRASLIITNHPR
jgi:hypothetical protein